MSSTLRTAWTMRMSCIAITCMTIGSRPDRWRRLEPPWTPRSSFSLHADRAAVSHPVARRLMSKNHPITACCQNENGGQSQHGSIILNPMGAPPCRQTNLRSEEHTSELQSLLRISYAVFCLNKKNKQTPEHKTAQAKSQ